MQKMILEMADRLRFDKLTIGQLKQLSEGIIELEERVTILSDRNKKLEIQADIDDEIIACMDGRIPHG